MTNRVSKLFILSFTILLFVTGGLFTGFHIHKIPASWAIPIDTEELQCPSCNSKKISYPTVELSEWKTFRSKEFGFEFRYPPAGQVQTYSETEEKKVRVDLPVSGGTLLQEKFFLVRVEKITEESPAFILGNGPTREVFINDREFLKKEFEEGAAGHLYEHTIYSTVKRGSRFVLDFVLHSVNPGALDSPPPGSGWREKFVFTKIASSFRFFS